MPGMGIPELPVPDGLMLRPFRGVRFAVEDPAKVTSPPYDLISDADVDTLLRRHPNNVVRLILPCSDPSNSSPTPRTTDPAARPTAPTPPAPRAAVAQPAAVPLEARYTDARDTLRAWLDVGILVPDEASALYVYEQSGPDVLQRGLIGDVGLADPGRRIILPHEDVMPGPVADRLALMSTTQANLEPIFLLYEGAHGAATRLVDEVATKRHPLVTAHTEDGLTHRLWAITDEAEIAAINGDLHDRQALIADGHHRYATYRVLQRQERATRPIPRPNHPKRDHAAAEHAEEGRPLPAGGPEPSPAGGLVAPWDFGLALLVDSTAYPPDLKAIHRVIPGLPLDEATAKARGSWRVRDYDDLAEGLTALESAQEPAFLLAGGDGAHLLTDPDPVQLAHAMPADHSDRWNSLNTSILTEFILPRVWGMRDDEQAVRIVHHDTEAAVRLAARTGGTAVILKPLAIDEVLAVAAGGERVPRKSTSFGPKPRTGLVLRTFAID
ncbi:DUF1015 family protein [Nonomuraea sp. 3N208]|uniref:DUF1015 family protein n=1 Tax=Nonomuraea sp. 3N208 TaxID=3457421 RepID=UPI003FCFE1A3